MQRRGYKYVGKRVQQLENAESRKRGRSRMRLRDNMAEDLKKKLWKREEALNRHLWKRIHQSNINLHDAGKETKMKNTLY